MYSYCTLITLIDPNLFELDALYYFVETPWQKDWKSRYFAPYKG